MGLMLLPFPFKDYLLLWSVSSHLTGGQTSRSSAWSTCSGWHLCPLQSSASGCQIHLSSATIRTALLSLQATQLAVGESSWLNKVTLQCWWLKALNAPWGVCSWDSGPVMLEFQVLWQAGGDIIFGVFFKDFIYLFIFREWGGEGKRVEKKHQCVVASHTPHYWGPSLQPRHVSWLGIKLATLWFTVWHSIHWATPGRHFLVCFDATQVIPFVNVKGAGIKGFLEMTFCLSSRV